MNARDVIAAAAAEHLGTYEAEADAIIEALIADGWRIVRLVHVDGVRTDRGDTLNVVVEEVNP